MQNQGMSRVEVLKALHDIELMRSSISWYLHLDEYNEYRSQLSQEDEIFLQENVRILKEFIQKTSKLNPSQQLMELACFYVGRTKGIKNPLDLLRTNRGGFSEKRQQQALSWIEYAQPIIKQVEAFSEERLQNLAHYLEITSDGTRHEIYKQIYNSTNKLGRYENLRNIQDVLIRELNSTEVSELAYYVLEIWAEKQQEDEDWHYAMMPSRLYTLHPEHFPPIQKQMFELGITHPYAQHIYQASTHELSLALQAKLNETAEEDYTLVSCFVWGKDTLVAEQFQVWDSQPPQWWKPSQWNPNRKLKDWTLNAGWELTPEGNRRYLYHETCYPLVPATGEKPTMRREDTCQWCNQKLDNFLDLDLTDARLSFLRLDGKRLVIAFCQWCHAFQDQYFELDFEGNTHWSAYNSPEPPSRIEYWDDERNTLVLAEKPRGSFESLALVYEQDGHSQIGGFPDWVNHEKFPTCPSCKKHMIFIGQVKWLETAEDHVEGTSYGFLCPDCKISLVNYDQT